VNSVWQLQDAKNRLSEVVDRALSHGAQTITRRGKPVAVLISAEEYERAKPRRKIVDILRECPAPGLEIKKLKDRPRDLEL
jgi:prevent-host-death family protein